MSEMRYVIRNKDQQEMAQFKFEIDARVFFGHLKNLNHANLELFDRKFNSVIDEVR